MKTYFFIDGKEKDAQEYLATRHKKGYVEKITYDANYNEIRNLEFNETEYKLNQLRKKRKYVLDDGFDKWEKAMLAGRETNDPLVYQWYEDLLDIEKTEIALENIPARVAYYLGG